MTAATDALGDQVQQACDTSGLEVLGFVVLTKHGAAVHAEARSRVGDTRFANLLAGYLAADTDDDD